MKRLAPVLAASIAFCSGFVTHAGAAIVHSGDLHPQRLGAAQNPFITANRISATSNASAARAERAITDAATVLAAGGVIKLGSGTLQLSGSGSYYYTGGTLIVSGATLSAGNFGVSSGTVITRQAGSGDLGPITITLTGNLGLAANQTVTLGTASGYTLEMGGAHFGLGTVTIVGGSVNNSVIPIIGGGTIGVATNDLLNSNALTGEPSNLYLLNGSLSVVKTGVGDLQLGGDGMPLWVTNPQLPTRRADFQFLDLGAIELSGIYTTTVTGGQNPNGVVLPGNLGLWNITAVSNGTTSTNAAVPEPASGLLVAFGAFAMVARRKRAR
jgi:autotransporter-associated beta strand protein